MMRTASLLALALLAGACAGNDPGVAGTVARTTTAAPATTTTTFATTNTTTVPVDLINPVDGTMAGVVVGEGPVAPMVDALTAAYGPPSEDTEWGPNDCAGALIHRYLTWNSLSVYMEEAEGSQTLMGYIAEGETDPMAEVLELPDGIELGMPYAHAAELYPNGAYTHESLQLDGVVLQEAPLLRVVGEHSDDGSARLSEVWVGLIPVCE
jgi:hypothetical protein